VPRFGDAQIYHRIEEEHSVKSNSCSLAICSFALLFGGLSTARGDGPLPEFTFKGVALQPEDLDYAPTDQLIHPTVIKTEARIENPLGKYYMYYAPHKHVAISMAYADSMDGPWTEYKGNPVIEGPSAPDIRWIEEKGKFYMWGHRKNGQTELWTSDDGLRFEYHSISVKAGDIDTRNATYSRVYEYPLEKYDSKYIMLYSGFIEGREIRCIWLAHSKDAENWVQLKTPLVEPIEGEMNDCYGPAFLRWKNRNFIVYQDHTTWRGGNIKYVEVDQEFNPVGDQGERYVLMDPPSDPPLKDRFRGSEFYLEGDTLYLYSSASRDPRLIVYATAKVNAATPQKVPVPRDRKRTLPKAKGSEVPDEPTASGNMSLDEILKDAELETIYETNFDEPIRMIHESELAEDGTIVRQPPGDVDWVLEGEAEVSVKAGRMHIVNGSHHSVLWNTRAFPESFVAEWDFQHHAPQGTAIFFFAAQAGEGGSIFTPGLPQRGGNFGKYTRGEINCYHTSYSATDEQGVPRGESHLKKDGKGVEKSKLTNGLAPIDGKTDRPFRLRLAKLKNRIILEIDGKISFDSIDDGEDGDSAYRSGQIGFRQMRHTIEASYGGLKIQRVAPRIEP
jgi:hypothetical protein